MCGPNLGVVHISVNLWLCWFSHCRLILAHFENKSVADIGGGEACCDNCSQRLREAREHYAGGGTGKNTSSLSRVKDYGKEAKDLLTAIKVS